VEREPRVCLPILLENNGFVNSTKYLDYSLNNPILLAIIALRARFILKWRSHLNSAGKPIENMYYNCLDNQTTFNLRGFPFQQMWFLSAVGTNLTYKVNALNETKAIYNYYLVRLI
jgi:hypothetical protein